MTEITPPLSLPVAAPEMVRRLGVIVAGMIAVVARRFLRDPQFSAVIVPLCGWLGRAVRRFGRVVARPAVARFRPVAVATVVATAVATVDARPARAVARVRVRLPGGKGWLVRALGWEMAGYGSQFEAWLAEPEVQALLARLPAAGRVLRPLCRMLGVAPVGMVLEVAPARVRVRKPRVRRPRMRREKAWSPGPIPDSWWPMKRG